MKLRRTLLTAGVFALLAMIYVPTPGQRFVSPGYRFIFSQGDTSIAFFQLLANVVFAALLGAIVATIVQSTSKRVWNGVLRIILPLMAVCLVIGGVFGIWTTEWQKAALSDERYADELLRRQHDVFDQAQIETYFRKATRNWRVALRFGEATRVENRMKELQQAAQDWQNDPVVDLSGLPDRAPGQKLKFDDLIPARTATPAR